MLDEDALSDFRREHLGFIFQDFNLLDTLTIEENIILAMSLHKSGSRGTSTGWKGARLRECAPPTDGETAKHGAKKARGLSREHMSKQEIDARVE